MFWWRLPDRITGHGDEFVAFTLVEDVQAGLGCSLADGDCTRSCFTLKSASQVINNCLAVIVKDLASTKPLDVIEVLRRGSGDDFVASGDAELNSSGRT